MLERRKRRSDRHHAAVSYYLEALRQQEGVEALALSDEEGLLMGGAGALDHEELGARGAAAEGAQLAWNQRTLHVTRLSLAGTQVVLTATGKKVPGRSCAEHLARLLC